MSIAFPVSRCLLLVEFALATLKIALNGWKLTIVLLLVTGKWVLLISGLDRCRQPLATDVTAACSKWPPRSLTKSKCGLMLGDLSY
jgi:hypothetical protein